MTFSTRQKVLENRVRRVAHQQGFRLIKSHKRRRWSLTYELWQIVDFRGDIVLVGDWPEEAHPALRGWAPLTAIENFLYRTPGEPYETLRANSKRK